MSSRYEIKPIPPVEFDQADSTGLQFVRSVPSINREINLDHLHASLKFAAENGFAIVLGAYHDGEIVGVLVALIAPDLFSGLLCSQEVLWYVKEEHRGVGVKLFREFERESIARGCKILAASHLVDSMPIEVARFYERMMYEKVDVVYRKELK